MSKELLSVNGVALINAYDKLQIPCPDEYARYCIFAKNHWFESHWMHDRSGDKSPFQLKLLPEYKIPEFDATSTVTFDDATNSRALEIEQFQNDTGLPILIYWSGGIDSTVALAAIIKNFKSLDNVTVVMNTTSYFENPVFFNRCVKNKIKICNVSQSSKDQWMNNIVVNGEPADQMYINGHILYMDRRQPNTSLRNVHTDGDGLINYFATGNTVQVPQYGNTHTGKLSALEISKWAYNLIIESTKSSPVPINTYADFLWWTNFNFFVSGNSIKFYYNNTALRNAESFSAFRKNFKPWFLSDKYQQWAMHNNSNGIKYNQTTTSYKMPSKQYIWELDRNDYYRYYKTKVGSAQQYMHNDFYGFNVGSSVALYDDGSIIRYDEINEADLLSIGRP